MKNTKEKTNCPRCPFKAPPAYSLPGPRDMQTNTIIIKRKKTQSNEKHKRKDKLPKASLESAPCILAACLQRDKQTLAGDKHNQDKHKHKRKDMLPRCPLKRAPLILTACLQRDANKHNHNHALKTNEDKHREMKNTKEKTNCPRCPFKARPLHTQCLAPEGRKQTKS